MESILYGSKPFTGAAQTCPRLSVGATIVRDKRMIAGGYNGSIAGGVHCADEGCLMIDDHCARTIHAEMNAILQCSKFGVPTDGAEIYVTHYPCIQCCKSIIQAGIKTVYYAEDYKTNPYAQELFEQAGVTVEQVELDEMIVDLKNREKLSFVAGLLEKLADAGLAEEDLKKIHEQANTLFTSYV